MVLLANLGSEQLVAAASGALQSQSAFASAVAAAEIAAIGVNNWGASLGLAACAAGVGAAAVAAAAGKLRCGADVQADECLGVSTAKTRAVSHSLSGGLHIGALGALAVYVFARTPGDRASSHPLIRWAPFVVVVLGSLMVLLDLTRHVLLDQNIAPIHLHMYNKDGSLTTVGSAAVLPALSLALFAGSGWRLAPPPLVLEPLPVSPAWLEEVAEACEAASSAALYAESAARAALDVAASPPPPPPPPADCEPCVCPEQSGDEEVALAVHVIVGLLTPAWLWLTDRRCGSPREEWCADLPCGARARVSYLGDLVDHERVVVSPSRREKEGEMVDSHMYWVLSPDLWEELLSGASPADGPSGGERMAANAAPPAGGRKFCGFRERLTLGRLVELAEECRSAMHQARGQTPAEGPAKVELPSGALLDSGEVFPWAPPPRAPALPARPFAGGDAADALAAAPAGAPTPPPEGHAWGLAEPAPGLPIGTIVGASTETLIGVGIDALWHRRGRAWRVQQMPEVEVADWSSRRADEELRRLLEMAPPAASPGDGPLALGAGPAPGEGAPPPGPGDRDAGADAGDDGPRSEERGGDDVRTLWVERGDQGERLIQGVQEGDQRVGEPRLGDWGHQRLEGGSTCLRTCKTMYRASGTPRAWLEKFLREKNIAPTDRVAQELRPRAEALEEAGCFDQLNLGGLACLEVVARRLNAIVGARKRGGAPSFANAMHLAPLGEADELPALALRQRVSRRAKEDWEAEQSMKKAEAVDSRVASSAAARASPLPPSDFERDLFPVPLVKEPGVLARGRRSQRRAHVRLREVDLVNRALTSLNWMAGFKGASSSPQPGALTLARRAAFQQYLWREAHRRRAAAPPAPPRAEAALWELLRGQSVYETDVAPRNLVSYQPRNVSLPESALECRFLEAVDFDSTPCVYMGPVLERSSKFYRAFVRDLARRGLLASRPAESVGIFFAAKSGGALRLIIDTRRSNGHFRAPGSVRLLSSEGFGRIEVELPPRIREGGACVYVDNLGAVSGDVSLSDRMVS
ncbi:unnamed protein product [Prorocentrum cordatum]|uniref:Uncharacterized protein n=1 Tax=Prorocentrum cordatum TaxID=2364126 RepID=A0ABN9U5F2_9DINO|nr:unnamed protein product [Polarella glacialis]